ncbi:MAG: hypothetical protein J7K98_00575 [Candidatus Aenigmarchaeota archaeon]|nr:hypothetical protein [Candidatus Aenigmarchaeota archaeon]
MNKFRCPGRHSAFFMGFSLLFVASVSSHITRDEEKKLLLVFSLFLILYLIGIVFFSSTVWYPEYLFKPRYIDIDQQEIEVYKKISLDKEEFAIVEFPLFSNDPMRPFYVIFHNHPIIGGSTSYAPPSLHYFGSKCGDEFPRLNDTGCCLLLRDWKIKILIVPNEYSHMIMVHKNENCVNFSSIGNTSNKIFLRLEW